MSLMSPRAMTTLRRNAEKWMVDEIELWTGSTWDDDANDDLEVEHLPGTMVWEGKARIRPTTGPREQAVGETVLALRDADINVPLDAPSPIVDMEVRVKTSEDSALQGRWFRVTDVRVFGQQASRKFSVVQFQRDKDWNP